MTGEGTELSGPEPDGPEASGPEASGPEASGPEANGPEPNTLNLDEILALRETTERISGFLNKRLKDHLSTLSSLLAPGRVFGKHAGSREAAPRADEALAELTEKYKQVSGFPLDLKPDLDAEVVATMGTVVHVYPYEYTYEARGAKAAKKISMTSPVRWVMTYGSELSVADMRKQLLAPGEHRSPPLRQAVVNALAFQVVLGRNAAMAHLLKDLRYDFTVEPLPGLAKLPLVVFRVELPSFRPPDEMLFTAVGLSGVPAFIELIDTEAMRNLADPLRAEIERLLAEE